jgi:hypothetical protein
MTGSLCWFPLFFSLPGKSSVSGMMGASNRLRLPGFLRSSWIWSMSRLYRFVLWIFAWFCGCPQDRQRQKGGRRERGGARVYGPSATEVCRTFADECVLDRRLRPMGQMGQKMGDRWGFENGEARAATNCEENKRCEIEDFEPRQRESSDPDRRWHLFYILFRETGHTFPSGSGSSECTLADEHSS